MKKTLSIMLVLIIAITLSSCASVKIDNNIENYAADVEECCASLFMPELEELPNYKEVEYYSKKSDGLFAESSIQLIVSYEEEIFLKEKERLKTAYTYLDEPQKNEGDDALYTIPLAEFSVAGFDFKVAKFDDTFYPKYFGMVGISDEKCQIAYLWVYAIDLDYICKTDANEIKEMTEFIEDRFSLE